MKLILQLIFIVLNISFTRAIAEDYLRTDWIDKTVDIKNDFYDYANGGWVKNNPIPADKSSWGSFSVLQEENQNKIHDMLMQASKDKNVKHGSIEQKIGDFYYSGMDVKNIDKLGISPLTPEFKKINSIQNLEDLQNAISHLHSIGIGVLFGFSSMQDFKDSTKIIAAVEQGGLSLPSRDYYIEDNKKFREIRDKFVQHMTKMFILLGENADVAKKNAQIVLKIETTLAKASMSQVDLRNPDKLYHIKTINELSKLTNNFSWINYLAVMGQSNLTEINVAMPDFMKELNKSLVSYKINDWKVYLTWHLIDSSASFLSKPFVDQNFKMAQALSGVVTIPPRWKRVVNVEDGFLGFAVGQLFVEKYFSKKARSEVVDMINNIRSVLRSNIKDLNWMSDATRLQALKKLDLIEDRVGYPDEWRDYSKLEIDRGPYILNILKCSAFLVKYDLDKIGKPVNRFEWEMTPQTVNAYYHPSMNSINIPMGILQLPYFDINAPASVNYGAIGVVIGHEITHGFDDQGAKFDASGNLHDWWTPEDLKKFTKATNCIAEQYSNYKVTDDIFVQGKLVVGEATADLGGLILAYNAYHKSKEYKNAKNIDGFTPDQQFFISFAHIWANSMRLEQAINLATIDPHPPYKYRVNGTLANIPEFKEAFGLPENSTMVNQKKCVIW
jgi:putative endopeptidase